MLIAGVCYIYVSSSGLDVNGIEVLRSQHITIRSCLYHLQIKEPEYENDKKKRKYPEELCISGDLSLTEAEFIKYFLSNSVFLSDNH